MQFINKLYKINLIIIYNMYFKYNIYLNTKYIL